MQPYLNEKAWLRMPTQRACGRNPDAAAIVLQKKYISKPSFKGTVMVNISITYPLVEIKGNMDSTQKISTFYKESARKYYEWASHELFNDAKKDYLNSLQQNIPFGEYEVMQTYEVPYSHNQLLSIYYDRYQFKGGAHGNTVRASNTWHVENGTSVGLGDFFTGSYYKSIFYEFITGEIKKQKKQGNTYYFDDYAKNVFQYFDENNYFLSDEGFVIYYPLYTIAAYAQGIPVFVVPYGVFGRELKEWLFK